MAESLGPVQACQTEFQDPYGSPGTRTNLRKIMAVTRPPLKMLLFTAEEGDFERCAEEVVLCVPVVHVVVHRTAVGHCRCHEKCSSTARPTLQLVLSQ